MDEHVVTKPAGLTGRPEVGGAEGAQGGAPLGRAAESDAATDQAAADEARARYRRRGVEWIDPDECIGPVLQFGEQLLAVRRSAVVHHSETVESVAAPPIVVDLYVTSRRLVLAGPDMIFLDLAALDEAVVSHERLLIGLRDGVGLVLEAQQPRLLRVQIAAARSARR